MKIFLNLLFLVPVVTAFAPAKVAQHHAVGLKMSYVPDGMSPEQYRKLRAKEQDDKKKKRFGAFGPQTFKSRSLQSFQTDLEKGKSGHLLPMMNAKEKLSKGKIKPEDVPYMQRGGAWDNSDVKTAKKKEWNEVDKKYNANYNPFRVDWTSTDAKSFRPPAGKQQKQQAAPPKKKLFGLF